MNKELKDYYININNAINNIEKEIKEININRKNIDKLGVKLNDSMYDMKINALLTTIKSLKEINVNSYYQHR